MPNFSNSIDELCARYVHDNGPGLALAVIKNGVVVYRKTFGLASLEHNVPITFDTVFETASVSKQATAFAVHLLVEDGKLSLDDDVREHVPDLPDFGTPITIRHCLHHTCGLRDWVESMGFAGLALADVSTSEHVFRWLQKQRGLNHSPGEEHFYTNTGYFVLAAVVAAVSEGSFAEFCHTRIFEPIGMMNTHFRETLLAVIKNRADSYYREDDGRFIPSISSQAVPGATSMQTTIDDMVLWLENYETGDVGGSKMLSAMHQPGTLNNGKSIKYGSGWELTNYRGEDIIWHSGGWACYGSLLWRMPSKGLAVAVLSNTEDMKIYDFWPPLADLFFEEKPGDLNVAVPALRASPLSASHSELAGLYVGPGGPVFEILENDDALWTYVSGEIVELIPLGGLRLHPVGRSNIIIEFFRDLSGRITHNIVAINDQEEQPRIKIEPETGTANLTDYVGTFYSDELEAAYTFSVKDGTLTASSIIHGDEPFKQVGRDFFIGADGPMPEILTFDRNAEGKVTAVSWSSCDARYQRFDLIQR